MGLKDLFSSKKIKEPIFYKKFEEDSNQLNELERILKVVSDDNIKKRVEHELYAIKKGIEGERAVCYEIKNSFIPMLVLHNIRIVVDTNVAQMDYVLITHKFIMVIETKKLHSDITINKYGDFELIGRTAKGQFYKQGIYSPIVQNERHIRILSKLLEKNNLLKKTPICSEIFLSNEKASIDRRYAPKDIANKVSKLDKFTEVVNSRINSCSETIAESKMYKIAELLIAENVEANYDYEKKFMVDVKDEEIEKEVAATIEYSNLNKDESHIVELQEATKDKLRERLINYRKIKAKQEKIQAYCIYKNETIENIIIAMPNSLVELKKVRGIGDKTVEKYGLDILEVLNLES